MPETTSPRSQVQLSQLPPDELRRYATELGLEIEADAAVEEVLRRVRQRQELLLELDPAALLDIVVWGRRPVRQSAGKEELARQIARITQTNYDSLSTRGLAALARLRDLPGSPNDSAQDLIDRLRKRDGFWTSLRRKRRAWVGSMLSKLIDKSPPAEDSEYKFLPEEDGAAADHRSLKEVVVEHGIVGGIAQKLRGAADDYIRIKLDEIEERIDSKLDQIDKRLGEWRDREVANRLKILRLTLVFSVLVALLSLGYNLVKSRVTDAAQPAGVSSPIQNSDIRK
ncbi:MAG TPA: hypothetical protein VMV81_08385 [Phycisphaerae bacterium]|nr:hypothetical protein [Phycisphaerae bacterium]